ncbi:MAG: zf-TFIIB domain-containing protein [Bacteroidota bacterium]
MNCPSCNVNLLMTDRNGIEIDYCPNCRGVWLDKGELDKIIERSLSSSTHSNSSHSSSIPNNLYAEKLKYEAMKKHHHKKHRGFLGDLFDF